jgi:hypothetical protein
MSVMVSNVVVLIRMESMDNESRGGTSVGVG